jgi:lysophospholipase L1-like esterase
VDRLDRDVLGLSGLTSVVWLEGINDIGGHNATAAQVIAGLQNVISRLRAHGVKVIGCTIHSNLNCVDKPSYGTVDADSRRQTVNAFIRGAGSGYDSVADMDAATIDPVTGELQAAFVPDSTKGGPGDMLHPNRDGYQAMADTVDLGVLAPSH